MNRLQKTLYVAEATYHISNILHENGGRLLATLSIARNETLTLSDIEDSLYNINKLTLAHLSGTLFDCEGINFVCFTKGTPMDEMLGVVYQIQAELDLLTSKLGNK